MGAYALNLNTTGEWNCAFGYSAMEQNTTGYYSCAMGYKALENGTGGQKNIAIGKFAGQNTAGDGNTIVGADAAWNLTTGSNNTYVGVDAGKDVTITGSNNLCLGHNAGRSNSPSGSITTGSNNVVLGDNDISNLYCADTSISSSDARDKTDVADFTKGLDWIKALRPVTYRWDRRTWYGTDEELYGTPDGSKKRDKLHLGFIAQEALVVEQANGYGSSNDDSLIVNLTDDGMSYGMKYERLVPVLVNAIKELEARLSALEG